MQVDENVALYLIQWEICVEFNSCAVQRFVSLTRCCNCQKIGHIGKDCRNEMTCSKYAGPHCAKECSKRKALRCANCLAKYRESGGKYNTKEPTLQHTSYDRDFPVFKEALRKIRSSQPTKRKTSYDNKHA